MFFDNSFRRPRRRHSQLTDWDAGDLRDSGIIKALAVGALIYIGAKTINRMTED
jgi:hypothetical protein